MRTTLTLDDDVATLLEEEAQRTRKPFKQVVNDAIRRGLAPRVVAAKPYRAPVHKTKLAVGVDVSSFNRLVDELETDAQLSRSSRT